MPRISLPPTLSSGPFHVAAGRAAGLGDKRLRGSDLDHPYHGVRAPREPASVLERCIAYAVRMPDHAFFCSSTAALLMGVPLPSHLENSRLVQVGVPAPIRAVACAGAVGRKLQVADHELQVWSGLRLTSPERTWCDLGSMVGVPDLVAAGDFLIRRENPLTSRSALQEAVRDFTGRRGRPALREALTYLSERSESRKESHLRVIAVRGGIEGVVANLEIWTSGGFNYRADLAAPSRKAVIEYQSDYHGDMAQFRRDMTRRGRLEADGWVVILVNADDLRDPAELLRRIHRTLASRPNR